jgi:hypothetical protein
MNIFAEKTKLTTLAALIGLYLIVSGSAYFVFSALAKNQSGGTKSSAATNMPKPKIDLSAPKTATCPINGQKFTEAEKQIWETRRPLVVMIENSIDARPQSGLSKSDVIYEAVAEGGITRFMAVYYCGAAAQDVRVGPVRSARIYFINWAAEYGIDPLYVHVGGANDYCPNCPGGVKPRGEIDKSVMAMEELDRLGWRGVGRNDFDGGTSVGYPIMWRDYERIPGAATEHTYMGSTDKIFDEAIKRGFGYTGADGVVWNKTFTSWQFTADQPKSPPTAKDISFEFWSNHPEYDVEWKYDPATNTYLRFNGGKEQDDMDAKQQLSAKNVVILFMQEKGPLDKELHMNYINIGTGKALVFQNGEVITGTWSKDAQSSRTIISDSQGKAVQFVSGRIWFETLAIASKVNY